MYFTVSVSAFFPKQEGNTAEVVLKKYVPSLSVSPDALHRSLFTLDNLGEAYDTTETTALLFTVLFLLSVTVTISRQTVSSELTPREFHPSDGLPEPPSLPATVLSRSDCDWTGVPLFSLWVMAKSEAIRYFQSVMNEITPFHRSLLLNRSWRTAAHAYAHHNHKEEVFGEWIFGCQGSLPFSPHKAKQVEGI